MIYIHIDTDNAAFSDGMHDIEICRILREIADGFEAGGTISTIRDINGNSVGKILPVNPLLSEIQVVATELWKASVGKQDPQSTCNGMYKRLSKLLPN